MKVNWKSVLVILLVIFIAIQFIPKNYPPNEPVDNRHIEQVLEVPKEVSEILSIACYDCHSNQIRYPWYSKVAPVSFLISHDIDEGKDELNFSEWGDFSDKRKKKKMEEIGEEVEEEKMPLPIYTITHGDARLTDAQREMLINWSSGIASEITSEE